MARSRNIKPGFFSNEDLVGCGFQAMLLFCGLWTIADREGRLEDRPKRIRALVFPYSPKVPVDRLLTSLASRGFIDRYEVNSVKYIAIPSWHRHQNPHIKEVGSVLPAPDKNCTRTVLVPEKAVASPEKAVASPASSSTPLPALLFQHSETPIVPLQGTGVAGKWSPELCAEFLKSIGWKSWSQLEPDQAEAIRAIPWKDLDQQETAPGSLPMLHTRLLLFDGIWSRYWRKDDKMTGLKAFMKHVKTDDAVADADAAIEAQSPEMLARPKDKRPLLATWINKFRWKTDKADAASVTEQGGEWNLN